MKCTCKGQGHGHKPGECKHEAAKNSSVCPECAEASKAKK